VTGSDGAPTLLMLGASVDQLPAYREARRRGFRLIGVDQNPAAPGAALADRFLAVSTRDTDGIVAALGEDRLTGIVVTGTDAALGSQRELATRLGLPYVPAARAVRASMDKTFFRQVVAECGLPTYDWVAGTDPAALAAEAARLPLPVVVKPTDASGGKGITLVTAPGELPAAIRAARAQSRSGVLLVEEYVRGRHYAVEIWMRGGEPHFVPVTEKRMTPLPMMVTTGHLIPARLEAAPLAEVRDTLVTLCRALDITDGPANFDFVRTDDGRVWVIEIGARLGGNAYPQLMADAWGVDTVAAAVSLAVGEPFDLTPVRSRVCLLHIFGSPLAVPAVLRSVSGVAAVRGFPEVRSVEVYPAPGDRVLPFSQSAHKTGYVVLVAAGHDEVDRALARVERTLCLDLVPASSLEPVDV
jgi:biotin carboxylase